MAAKRSEADEKQVFFSSNWADLHGDVLDLIIQKLVSLCDLIRFSLVCKPWNSISLIHKQKLMSLINHQSHWLFLRNNQILHSTIGTGSEFQHTDYCFGSSYRWLLYKEDGERVIVLFHPISGTAIRLPPISLPKSLRDARPTVKFLTLSNDPNLGSFEVLATCYVSHHCDIVAHLRFGSQIWTYSEKINRIRVVFRSFAFYRNYILGVSKSGGIWSLDIIRGYFSSRIEFEQIAADLNKKMSSFLNLSIFVETTSGDLLMVRRYLYSDRPEYKIFKIMVSDIGQFGVVPVEKLEGHSLFLEKNSCYSHECISVLARNIAGCRENTIYYSCGYFKVERLGCVLKRTIEEFNLDNQSLHRNVHSFPVSNIDYSRIRSSMFWLVPSNEAHS